MEAFLHSSLGSSLCAEYDNLVRSAQKITHAGKEHHLHKQKTKQQKIPPQTHRETVKQVEM